MLLRKSLRCFDKNGREPLRENRERKRLCTTTYVPWDRRSIRINVASRMRFDLYNKVGN